LKDELQGGNSAFYYEMPAPKWWIKIIFVLRQIVIIAQSVEKLYLHRT
jgi:hypothetical protein